MEPSCYNKALRHKIDSEFSLIHDKCYLDYAGCALYSNHQINSVANDLCSNLYGNPHSSNIAGRFTEDVIDQIRTRILRLFHTTLEEYSIIFTSGATASIKLLLESFQYQNKTLDTKSNASSGTNKGYFIYTSTNHTSVLGGRIIASNKGASIICLQDNTAQSILNNKSTESKTALPSNDDRNSSNSLFAYPAQCNFSGRKFPLRWLDSVRNGALNNHPDVTNRNTTWYSLLDAAAFCGTNDLDLSSVHPDFVCVSFYKIFGYPTGLGALLVRNKSAHCLEKQYFGGGTIDIAIPSQSFYVLKKRIHTRFEDGTLPYLSIVSLAHGLDTLDRLQLTMEIISRHVFSLARHVSQLMAELIHWTKVPLVLLYSEFADSNTQGGIVAFNLKRADGSYIGYNEVQKVADSCNIQLRTGCFCNIGACQRYLRITDSQLLVNFQAGHVCGDERDLVDGKPTGAVRISFGYPSSSIHVDTFMRMLSDTFLEVKQTSSLCMPSLSVLRSKKFAGGALKKMRIYPVKSCGAMEVLKWRMTPRGLLMDRNWMIVTPKGVCLTQKEEPMMCKILPEIDLEKNILQLSFQGLDLIKIKIIIEDEESDGGISLCSHKVCGDRVKGVDCGPIAGEWLSQHLLRPGLRLVQQSPRDARQSSIQRIRATAKPSDTDTKLSLANQAQYLLINEASISWLRSKIQDEPDFNHATLDDRFRANFIITGIEGFEECQWEQIQIGNAKFKIEGPCTRCQMICIDQQTGEKNRKPLVELSKALGGKLRFGIYCSYLMDITADCVELAVGDLILPS